MSSSDLPAPPSGLRFDTDATALHRFVQSHAGPCVRPRAIASPRGEPHIASLVAWANRHAVPLVPVSSPDGPRRRHDTAPTKPSVVVDLSGMDRVIHVDGRDRIAVIEPGVTFPAFDAALQPHGLRSLKPLLPRRGKSVLGAYLEREPFIAPQEHWDSTDPLASLSITFGSGERFRTGGGSLPGTLEENLARGNRQMMASGPIVTDYSRVLLGSQGTLGIVSWGSIYCEPLPAREEARFYGADDYAVLAELARLLLLRQLGTHCFMLDRTQAAAALAEGTAAFEPLLAGTPRWLLYVSLTAVGHLPDQRMAWQGADLDHLAETVGAQRWIDRGDLSAARLAQRLQHLPATFYKDVPRGAHEEVFCLTQLDRVPQLLAAAQPVLSRFGIHADGSGDLFVGHYVQPTVQGSNCHFDMTLFHVPGAEALAQALQHELVTALMDAGGFFSRPYGRCAEAAYARDAAIVPYLKTVKHLFDPKGVLNPGRLCF
jgi:FAD/FMN-containing dehydrogenase